MSLCLKPNDRILFIGDSITDCGRSRPVGHRWGADLGKGYVSMVDQLIGARYPEIPLRVLNTGISGNRVIDLEARWAEDVLAHQPDWLSVMIGINDVWRQFDGWPGMEQVDAGRYREVYGSLLERTRPQLDGLVLMTPFFLETNREDPMRRMMDEYGAITRELAERHDAVFVDVQAAFDAYLAKRPSQSLCADRVHPNPVGHMIIAQAFLKAIGDS